MNQFGDHVERAAHAEMLRRIYAATIQDIPEPNHEPSWVVDWVFCEPDPIRHWCCEWHEHHADKHGKP